MKLLIPTLLGLALLAGCENLAELPSLQYCEHVTYERGCKKGDAICERTPNDMHIEADCLMPYGRI